MVGKFYAIKDEKSIHTGTVISTIFAVIISGGCYFLGGFGRLFDGKEIYDASGVVVFGQYYSSYAFLPSGYSDRNCGGVGSVRFHVDIGVTGVDFQFHTDPDFLKDTLMQEMSEKKQIRVMQILVVFFIAVSVLLAWNPPTFIAQLMGISWGALAGAFLAPFLYGLYWKRVTKASVWASFAVGVGITVSNMVIGYIESPINAGAFAMAAGLVVVPVVSLLTPKPEQEQVDQIFECYEERL